MAEIFINLNLPPYKLFDLYISGKGLTNKWIARYLSVDHSLISKIRSGNAPLTENMRLKLNDLLETDY